MIEKIKNFLWTHVYLEVHNFLLFVKATEAIFGIKISIPKIIKYRLLYK